MCRGGWGLENGGSPRAGGHARLPCGPHAWPASGGAATSTHACGLGLEYLGFWVCGCVEVLRGHACYVCKVAGVRGRCRVLAVGCFSSRGGQLGWCVALYGVPVAACPCLRVCEILREPCAATCLSGCVHVPQLHMDIPHARASKRPHRPLCTSVGS